MPARLAGFFCATVCVAEFVRILGVTRPEGPASHEVGYGHTLLEHYPEPGRVGTARLEFDGGRCPPYSQAKSLGLTKPHRLIP